MTTTITQAEALEAHLVCVAAGTTLPAVSRSIGRSGQYGQVWEDLALGRKRTEEPAANELRAAVNALKTPPLVLRRSGNSYTLDAVHPPADLRIICEDGFGEVVFRCTGEEWSWLYMFDVVRDSSTKGKTFLFHDSIQTANDHLAARA